MSSTVGRYAPSPSGRMHLGNLCCCLLAWLSAKSSGGKVVLRIEDLDPDRCRPDYIETLKRDLDWLGLLLCLLHLLPLLVELSQNVLEVHVVLADKTAGLLQNGLVDAEPLGDGERIGLAGHADEQPVGRLERLDVKLARRVHDGVLNALLTALNERKYTNEGRTYPIPTISFFAASNEIPNFNDPEEKILSALYDRLELKVVTENISEKAHRLAILKDKLGGSFGAVHATISLEELRAMQQEVKATFTS